MNFKLKNVKDKLSLIFDAFSNGAEVAKGIRFAAVDNKLYTTIEKKGTDLIITFLNPKPVAVLDIPIITDPRITINFIKLSKNKIYISLKNCVDLELEIES